MKILFSILCGLVILFVGGCAFILTGTGMGSAGSDRSFFNLLMFITFANILFLVLANVAFRNRGMFLMGAAVLYAILAGLFVFNADRTWGGVQSAIYLVVVLKALFAFFIGYQQHRAVQT
jgi:hypothetical protein